MKDSRDEKELASFETKSKVGAVIAAGLAVAGFTAFPLPEMERIGTTVMILSFAALVYIFRKSIARFALAEKRFWETPLRERLSAWQKKRRP